MIEHKLKNRNEVTRIQAEHRIQLIQCVRCLKAKLVRGMKDWRVIMDRLARLTAVDTTESKITADQVIMSSENLEMQQGNTVKEIQEITLKLKALRQADDIAFAELMGKQKKELTLKKEDYQKSTTVSSSLLNFLGARTEA